MISILIVLFCAFAAFSIFVGLLLYLRINRRRLIDELEREISSIRSIEDFEHFNALSDKLFKLRKSSIFTYLFDK